MKIVSLVKIVLILIIVFVATMIRAQTAQDDAAIRNIIQEEITTWKKGDAEGYSRPFAVNCTFTNVLGMFFTGREAFQQRHDEIFKGKFQGTVLQQDIVSLKYVSPDVAVVETLTWVSGFSKDGPPPGTHTDTKGRLCTRLLQVLVREGKDWKIEVYHNVDVKPGVKVPEPK